MPSRPPATEVAVIVTGALMSGLGLQEAGRLHMRAAVRVALTNVRRGFGKLSQQGDRLEVVLELVAAERPLEASVLAAEAPPTAALEAVAFVVQGNDLAHLCDRHGYSGGAVRRLRDEAAQRGQGLADFLWSMLADNGFQVAAFRQRLFKLVGYTSPHAVPHPVRLDAQQYALTFLAPGAEGSGSERVVPTRVRTGYETLLSISDACQRKPNRTQLTYCVTCLLAGVHGVSLGDVLPSLMEDEGLAQRLRTAVAAEQRHEVSRFLDMTGLDHDAYWQSFGPPTQALRRSGLEGFLRG